MVENEGAGEIGLECIGFQKRQRLGIFADRVDVQSVDADIAGDDVAVARQFHIGDQMRGMTGDFDLRIHRRSKAAILAGRRIARHLQACLGATTNRPVRSS